MRFLVTSIFLYACESLTLTAELQRRIQAVEMNRKILHISYDDDEMNPFCVRARVEKEVCEQYDFVVLFMFSHATAFCNHQREDGVAGGGGVWGEVVRICLA